MNASTLIRDLGQVSSETKGPPGAPTEGTGYPDQVF